MLDEGPMWTTDYTPDSSSLPVSMRKWRKGKTMMQLYDDREKTGWYWRLLGVLASSIILLGYDSLSGGLIDEC